jgi:hypothetical protein
MAPWVHTYISPQTERRLCCASREPAQNFKQYIDTSAGTNKYVPIALVDHWNSDHMRSVRRRMMDGETLPECEVCNSKILNTSVYRTYFDQLFGHKLEELWNTTDDTGRTTMQPVSWDYRFSNLCNFKCRMCGDMLSSSWETEEKKHSPHYLDMPSNAWATPKIKKQIEIFQVDTVEQEFALAVEQHRVEEIYWVGGEPLMYEQHWKYMKRIADLGDGPRVYARYNSNLSRVNYRGMNLYTDILSKMRDWQMCASIDGTGAIGEYIRTGLRYTDWLDNFKQGVAIQKNRRQMRLDFTLTLPGMFEVENIMRLAQELDVEVLAKVVFSFSPNIIMSPLALPRDILHPWIDQLLSVIPPGAMYDILVQLKNRPTFDEQWPDTYAKGLAQGKSRVLHLENIRECELTFRKIMSAKPELLEWWDQIEK